MICLNQNFQLCISGVKNEVWYRQKKIKPEVATLNGQTNQELDFMKREEVYQKYRPEMIVQFRYIFNECFPCYLLPYCIAG